MTLGAERQIAYGASSFGRLPTCRNEAARAIRALGPLAEKNVNAGGLLYVGEVYGWAEWLVDGTGFAPGRPMPKTIRLSDELIAAANLYDHVDPFDFSIQIMRLPLAGMTAMTALGFQVAPTLGEALAARASSHSRAVPHIKIEFERLNHEGATIVRSDFVEGRLFDCYAMGILGLFYAVGEAIVPQIGHSTRIELRIEGPRQHLFSNEVRCPVQFGSKQNRLIIDQFLLDLPNPRFDSDLWELTKRDLHEAPARMVASLSEVLMGKVCAHLDQRRVPRLKQIANELQVSERTIVRLLHSEGTSFRLLVDEERRARAANLLADPAIELSHVCELLGFADRPSFWRTFRRWFGITPAQFRRE